MSMNKEDINSTMFEEYNIVIKKKDLFQQYYYKVLVSDYEERPC